MKVVIWVIMVLIFIWYANNGTKHENNNMEVSVSKPEKPAKPVKTLSSSEIKLYECDGRQYCSQMTSCEEAMFFLKNCPEPKMDGNGDGIPCERQWCN